MTLGSRIEIAKKVFSFSQVLATLRVQNKIISKTKLFFNQIL